MSITDGKKWKDILSEPHYFDLKRQYWYSTNAENPREDEQVDNKNIKLPKAAEIEHAVFQHC